MGNCLQYWKMSTVRNTKPKTSQQLCTAVAYKYVYVALRGTTSLCVAIRYFGDVCLIWEEML